VTEPEIEATYGPVHSSFGVSRRGVAVGMGIAGALFVLGAALLLFAVVFLRVPGERPMEQLGMLFVGGFVALVVAPLLVLSTARSLGDRLELRALGVVRRSRQLGLKHLHYSEITRIEHRKRGDTTRGLDVFASDGRLIGVGGYARDGEEMAQDLERRVRVQREIVRI